MVSEGLHNQIRHFILSALSLLSSMNWRKLLEKTHFTLLGSHDESSKVRDPNGFDFMFYLSSLAENSAPSYSPNDTAGYCKFEFKDGKGSELVAWDHALSLSLYNLFSGGGHDTFLLQITCKKARIWTFFWLDRKQYRWFALFRLAKTPPSVSCWFQSALLLA